MMEREQRVSLALGRVRAEFTPSSEDKARLRAALGLAASTALVSPPASAVPPAPAVPSRWAALRASGLLGAGMGALLLGSGVGVGLWWGGSAARQTPALTDVPVSVRVDERSRVAQPVAEPLQQELVPDGQRAAALEPVPQREAAAGSPRVERVRPRAAPRRGSSLDEELALLRRVERALRGQDAALALALLRELDERFPDTRLGEERLAARCMAHCRQRSSEPLLHQAALQQARRFLDEHPASVYSERVAAACELASAAR